MMRKIPVVGICYMNRQYFKYPNVGTEFENFYFQVANGIVL